MKELKSRDKVTQRMSKDGLIKENQTTGKTERVSGRETEQNFSPGKETVNFRSEVEKSSVAKPRQRRPSSRLQFTDEELHTPELQPYIRKSNKQADKLDKARGAIPKKREITKKRIYDEKSGKVKTKLRFDKADKELSRFRPNPISRPASELRYFAHGKIHEVEGENTGVESGHKAEELAERGVGGAIRWERQHRKMKPYKAAEKAERKAIKANAEFMYHKTLHDNPQLAGKNPVSRMFQKQQLKRRYAKAARKAKNSNTVKKSAEKSAKAAKKAAEEVENAISFTVQHWKGVLIVGGIFLFVVMMISGLQSCSLMFSGGGIGVSTYMAEDEDIFAAEAAYGGMEAELQSYISSYETTHNYDEYHFDIDGIGHDPYVLISIISTLHEGVWTVDEVQGTLQMLFGCQYILTETVETETRYRTETHTGTRPVIDPETGETVFEEFEFEVQIPYPYRICSVTLENVGLGNIPESIMTEEQFAQYTLYMYGLGNRPDLLPEYAENYLT